MRITSKKKNLIYDGQDGFVVTFCTVKQNNQPATKVDCYAPSSIFSVDLIKKVLTCAANGPIGRDYDVIFRTDMDSIVFSKGFALGSDTVDYFLVIVPAQTKPERFAFYTNIASNAKFGEEPFHNIVRMLLSSMQPAGKPISASKQPPVQEDYDDDDFEDGEYYEDNDDDLYPEVSEEVYALYTCNLLFNLFGDQLLSVVCSSKGEYNDFVIMLRELGIITAPSLNADGWNDVMKYIMYDAERNTAYATCYPEKTVDIVLPVSDFLAKISQDAKDILNV